MMLGASMSATVAAMLATLFAMLLLSLPPPTYATGGDPGIHATGCTTLNCCQCVSTAWSQNGTTYSGCNSTLPGDGQTNKWCPVEGDCDSAFLTTSGQPWDVCVFQPANSITTPVRFPMRRANMNVPGVVSSKAAEPRRQAGRPSYLGMYVCMSHSHANGGVVKKKTERATSSMHPPRTC